MVWYHFTMALVPPSRGDDAEALDTLIHNARLQMGSMPPPPPRPAVEMTDAEQAVFTLLPDDNQRQDYFSDHHPDQADYLRALADWLAKYWLSAALGRKP